jgi:threonine dehydrogenase-like Zn-dependent dehydrogenase
MRALVIEAPGRICIREVPVPGYEGECLVRMRRAGICGTDLEILQGYADFQGIPGPS